MPKKNTLKWYKLPYEALRHFREDDGFTLAAALSFYAILSLIPLTMIVVSILGHWVGQSEQAMQNILRFISDTIPYLSPTFLKNLSTLIHRKLSGGWVGVVALFLVASVLFSNLEKVLDKIFESNRKRNFFHSKLLSVFFIFLIALLMFIPSVLKSFDYLLALIHVPFQLEKISEGPIFYFLMAWSSFVLVLSVVPKHQVKFQYNAIGGLMFAALMIAVRWLFQWYILFSLERFQLVYGSLTAVILIILWIFYFMNLFIFCAEFVGLLQDENS